jgi:putative membrane protein
MKKFVALSAAAALSMALAACGSKNDTANETNMAGNMEAANETGTMDNNMMATNGMNATAAMPMTAQAFADAASASDAYEIAASKLAETKASSGDVKSFAADMVKDHTKSTADLKAAAAKADGKPMPAGTMTADQQANMTKLQGLSGADFDKEYVTQQVDAHQKALDALQGYAAGGDSAPLKEFATKTATVVQHHLDMAKKLQK